MYESHFGFDSRPFAATPDAARFFPTANTKRSFESIVACVQRATGAALIVGGSGLGKSVLLKAVGKHFQAEYSVAVLDSASLQSRKELLQNILFELGLPFHGMEEGELRLTLMDYLKPSDRCPNGLLLCVDEAHLLSSNLLEEMRMITNLVRDGQPRARLVLAGNPSIEERMAEPQLESLSQRISTRVYLEAMTAGECQKYVADCLQYVGKSVEDVFDAEALEAIFIATHGIPRLVNQVCDHALVLAVADGKSKVSQSLINEAWSDIQRLPVDWNVLGAQTNQKNEHVIEFGDLDGQTFSSEAESEELVTSDNENVEQVDSAVTSAEEATAEVETKPPFVFQGPRNPFAEEEFPEEEKVVDQFSQLIGHTPLQPSFPTKDSLTGSTQAEKPNAAESKTSEDSVDDSQVSIDSTVSAPTAPADESVSAVSSDQKPEADSTEVPRRTNPRTNPLSEYLANTREAITFGVGQGFDSDDEMGAKYEAAQVSSVSGTENEEKDTDVNDNGVGENSLESETPVQAFGTDDESDEISERTFTLEGTVSIPDASDANLQAVENEINRTVEEIQQGIDDAVSQEVRGKGEEDKTSSRQDDRDMIVVEEEEASSTNTDAEANTVPMHESESPQKSTQAKREDYRQLFDRLRNG